MPSYSNLAKIPATTLQNAPNFQYPGKIIVPIHHFCIKTDLSVWVIICILKWSFLLKSFPQNFTSIWFLSSMYKAIWLHIQNLAKIPATKLQNAPNFQYLGKIIVPIHHFFMKTTLSAWVIICILKWSFLLKFFPQNYQIWYLSSVYKAMFLHIWNLAKIPAQKLQNVPNFQYPGQIIVPIHHFFIKTTWSVCVIICIFKWSFLLKSFPKNIQVYGFFTVCIRLRAFIFEWNIAKIRATKLQNAPIFQYPGQIIVPIHYFCMKTTLSVWVIICILKWSFLLKSFPQNLYKYMVSFQCV